MNVKESNLERGLFKHTPWVQFSKVMAPRKKKNAALPELPCDMRYTCPSLAEMASLSCGIS